MTSIVYANKNAKRRLKSDEPFLEAHRSESREDIGFAPIGLDEPYRVIISEDPIGLEGRS